MSGGVSFKVRFSDNMSRFRLATMPSWLEFLEVLEEQIFRGTYHKELLLLPDLPAINDIVPQITSESDWQTFTELYDGTSLVKFEIREGDGIYFKDAAPPEPVEFYSATPTIYKTQVKYSDEERWCPFSQFEVSMDGTAKLGTNNISQCKVDGLHITWDIEDNQCSGDVTFSDNSKKTFSGSLFYPNGEEMEFRGEEMPGDVEPEVKKKLTTAVPRCLEVFFPNGKILPNHLPACLKGVVTVIPVSENDVKLDINVKALYAITHQRAIDLLQEKNFVEAEKFFLSATEISPNSDVVFYNLACCYALQNRKEDAIANLQQAVALGYSNADLMTTDPDLGSILHTPEFWHVVDQIKGE